jgi:hypothetical protein
MSVNDEFEALTAGLRVHFRDPVAYAAVRDAMVGRKLAEIDAQALALRLKCSRSTIRRLRDEIVAEMKDDPAPANAFEAMEHGGGEDFYFDEVMMVIYVILGCSQKLLRTALEGYGHVVSAATMCRRFKKLSPRVRDGLKHGHRNRYKFQLTRRFESSQPYELGQTDEFVLDIDVLVPAPRGCTFMVDDDGNEIPLFQPDGPGTRRYVVMRPRLLLYIDAYSRYVLSWAVLYKPAATMRDTLALYADGFLMRQVRGKRVGGAPEVIGTDNGGALVGHVVKAFMKLLGIVPDIALGYSPQSPSKAKVEANGRPLQEMLVTGLPGRRTRAETVEGYDLAAVDPTLLLRCDAFTAHAAKVFEEWNFTRVHGSTGEIPFERLTNAGVVGTSVDDEALAQCFLPNDLERPDRLTKAGRREVDKEGVRLRDGTYHQAVEFFDHIESTVEIRTLHHNDDYAAAFELDGRFIGLTKSPSAWTEDDDRARNALARDATHIINRVHKRARDYSAAAPASDPDAIAAAAVDLAKETAEVAPAKSAKRNARRPQDVGPSRRAAAKEVTRAEAAADYSDLEASMRAMQAHVTDDDVVVVETDPEDTL